MSKPYRLNAGIIIANNKGQVLLCARADQADNNWQFPQGGIDKDEAPLQAAIRELYEETGIKSAQLIAQMPYPVRYDFPPEIAKHSPFCGQEQHWFLFEFTGNEKEINLKINPNEIEFKAYQWSDITIAPKLIVKFKKKVYNEVVDYFAPIINQQIIRKQA